jgi:uncharacterized protein DUF1707/cell wall-active antibiotic response 4TMS protein YvqF
VSESAEHPKHLELRASDADRERVAKILHEAMGEGRLDINELDERLQSVYQAKTLGDLVPLTADLPVSVQTVAPVPTSSPLPDSRIGGTPAGNVSVAVMSGFERKGEWVVPREYSAIAFMGGGELDLTDARFAERECTIHVFAFMGGIEITVPEDVTVHVNGFAFMGGFDRKGAHQGPPGAPVLTVNGFAFMGGVEVRPPKRKKRKIKNYDRRELED